MVRLHASGFAACFRKIASFDITTVEMLIALIVSALENAVATVNYLSPRSQVSSVLRRVKQRCLRLAVECAKNLLPILARNYAFLAVARCTKDSC